jgi:hypothetical protein
MEIRPTKQAFFWSRRTAAIAINVSSTPFMALYILEKRGSMW